MDRFIITPMHGRKNRAAASIVAALATAGLLLSTAVASAYDQVSLNHAGYCVGYGWSNSADPAGVFAGTSQTSGGGPCYRKMDAIYYYNSGSVFNPSSTGYQGYDVSSGAGPGGICDSVSSSHSASWTGGDTGAAHGNTQAGDC